MPSSKTIFTFGNFAVSNLHLACVVKNASSPIMQHPSLAKGMLQSAESKNSPFFAMQFAFPTFLKHFPSDSIKQLPTLQKLDCAQVAEISLEFPAHLSLLVYWQNSPSTVFSQHVSCFCAETFFTFNNDIVKTELIKINAKNKAFIFLSIMLVLPQQQIEKHSYYHPFLLDIIYVGIIYSNIS